MNNIRHWNLLKFHFTSQVGWLSLNTIESSFRTRSRFVWILWVHKVLYINYDYNTFNFNYDGWNQYLYTKMSLMSWNLVKNLIFLVNPIQGFKEDNILGFLSVILWVGKIVVKSVCLGNNIHSVLEVWPQQCKYQSIN